MEKITKLPIGAETVIKEALCKTCKKLKNKLYAGRYNDANKSPRWLGEDNLYWNGRVCGTCDRERAKHGMKESRKNKKIKVYMDKITAIKNES